MNQNLFDTFDSNLEANQQRGSSFTVAQLEGYLYWTNKDSRDGTRVMFADIYKLVH